MTGADFNYMKEALAVDLAELLAKEFDMTILMLLMLCMVPKHIQNYVTLIPDYTSKVHCMYILS